MSKPHYTERPYHMLPDRNGKSGLNQSVASLRRDGYQFYCVLCATAFRKRKGAICCDSQDLAPI